MRGIEILQRGQLGQRQYGELQLRGWQQRRPERDQREYRDEQQPARQLRFLIGAGSPPVELQGKDAFRTHAVIGFHRRLPSCFLPRLFRPIVLGLRAV
jgi:hypothetical protein